jgi:transposase
MVDQPIFLDMSDEDSASFEHLFNPVKHGEIRLELDQANNRYLVNWYSTDVLSWTLLESNTPNEKDSAAAFVRLHQTHLALLEKSRDQSMEIQRLKEQNATLSRKIFGTSSEQSAAPKDVPEPDQLQANEPKPETAKILKLAPKSAGRKPLPPELPRETINHSLSVEEQSCPCCQNQLCKCGEEVIERLSVIPEHYRVTRHVQTKYVCRTCETFTVAKAPKSMIPGSSYGSPEFLASVAVKRYQYGLPFYRQEQIFKSMGLPFNRTTLANLMITCADKLTSMYEVLKDELRSQPIIHADETTIQVLKEPGREAQSKSYVWLYRSAQNAFRQIVLFDYQETRAGKHPLQFLSGDEGSTFKGYLCVDGYPGYNKIPNVTRVGCMAHLRRKFDEALKALPTGAEGSLALYALDMIGKLYCIEKEISADPPDKRYRIRQDQSIPILEKIKAWLEDLQPKVVPKSLLGKAINYALEQWYAVSRYVEDGNLAIDNNIAEREIKPFVIGRKNWLFADSVDGAYANAVMYSLVNTAIANGVDPYLYLYHLFEKMPYANNVDDVRNLLPWYLYKATGEQIAA